VEGYWAGDLMSLLNHTPTTMNLHALEDCDVLAIKKSNIEYAIKNLPEFAIYQFRNQTKTVSDFKESIGRDIIESPESKYLRFTQEHPELLQRLPQYHIASYLGVTPETLSRIRKKSRV
jgi:CRP-like cAMP-binding protein